MKLARCFTACERCGRVDVMSEGLCLRCRERAFCLPAPRDAATPLVMAFALGMLALALAAVLREVERPREPPHHFAPTFDRPDVAPRAIVNVCELPRKKSTH